jgi:low temperature requirement protein LtrA
VTEESERHATNLELFLDVVFVFAVTQIAALIGHDPTAAGVGKGALIAWLVWWQWSQFTWAGSAIDLQSDPRRRVLVLCIIPVTLLMTISIPEVFHGTGVWFATTYLGVQLISLAMQATAALGNPMTRRPFIRYSIFAAIAPCVVLSGAFAHDGARISIWSFAALLNLVGAFRAGGDGEWVIDPVHFTERHALFVIISLGEVLVAAGAAATDIGLDRPKAIAIVVAVSVACVLWWTYFAFIPDVAEHTLRQVPRSARGSMARDIFTLGHFPIVFGIVLYAVVVKHLIPHPTGHLAVNDRWLLACAAASFIGGLLGIQYRVVRRLAPERAAAIAVVAGLCALGGVLPGRLVIVGVAVVVAAMQTITWRRFKGGALASTISGATGETGRN